MTESGRHPPRWALVGQELLTVAVVHLVVPAALIAMVTAFLWFLLEVRAVLTPSGTFTLKWIGTCLIVASVLIVRHARTAEGGIPPVVYLLFLGAASTFAILFVAPRTGSVGGRPSTVAATALLNLAATLASWWLATALTRQMSLDPPSRSDGPVRYFGDGYRAWRARQEALTAEPEAPATVEPAPTVRRENPWLALLLVPVRAAMGPMRRDPLGNPARGVARLMVGALFVLACAEPLLLAAPPAVGRRALDTLLAFLASGGILLAAGSVVGTMAHAHRRGGDVSLGLIPLRTLAGGGLVVVAMAIALHLPGLRFAGTGDLRAVLVAPSAAPEAGWSGPSHGRPVPHRGTPDSEGVPLAGSFLALGKVLLVPVAVLLSLGAAWLLLRLDVDWTGLLQRAWDRLRALLSAWRGGSGGGRLRPRPAADPFAGLEALSRLDPDEAVRAAYGRLLDLAAALGQPRPEDVTPLEFLRQLPPELRPGAVAFSRLTLVYVRVAYGRRAATERDRDDAIAALRAGGDGMRAA